MGWARGFGVVVGATLAVATVGVVALAALSWEPRRLGPAGAYSVRGIDVSHHQGTVGWEKVAGSGEVQFVFVKATEGRTHVDRKFLENWKGARAAGLATGAYHYFSACRTGAEQAAHFLATVPEVPDALPAVLDVEADRRCNRGTRLNGLAGEVTVWLDAVEARSGRRPLVYSSVAFRRSHLGGVDADWWTAAYSREPKRSWRFWQHTDRGRTPGVSGLVDQNVFSGTAAELAALHSRAVVTR